MSGYLRHELTKAEERIKSLENQLTLARAANAGTSSLLLDVQREGIWFREALRVLIDKARPDGIRMVVHTDRVTYRKIKEMLYPPDGVRTIPEPEGEKTHGN